MHRYRCIITVKYNKHICGIWVDFAMPMPEIMEKIPATDLHVRFFGINFSNADIIISPCT